MIVIQNIYVNINDSILTVFYFVIGILCDFFRFLLLFIHLILLLLKVLCLVSSFF